jgi:hypothetical protein
MFVLIETFKLFTQPFSDTKILAKPGGFAYSSNRVFDDGALNFRNND